MDPRKRNEVPQSETKEQKNKRIKEQKEKGKRTSGKMFVNFFLRFGSWRSLIRIQLEFKYLC